MSAAHARLVTASALALAAVLAASFLVSDGFLNVDEFVYFMGAQAFQTAGGFSVHNGWPDFSSPDLRIYLLAEGPGGLVPQYPAGTALAGGALIPVFGQRSLIALNVAAGIGTLFVAHGLARRLFDDTRVADLAVFLLVFATFWSEYVFGHWPHAISVFWTTLALVLFLDAIDRDRRAWLPAFFSGLAVGTGMLFRLDGILLLPAIAAVTILWAARPIHVLAGGAAGVLPMTVGLAATNAAKFGTWNPLSYGGVGGGTNLTGHLVSIAVILAALAGLVLMRAVRTAAIAPRIWRVAPIAVFAGLTIALLTPLAPLVWSLLRGIQAILVDATAISDPRPGVVAGPGGTLSFWGFPKKALFQSLPWLGCLAVLPWIGRRPQARGIAIVLLVFAVWSLPFIMRSWHGGLGSNMRYLLPTLPALSALAAWTILCQTRRSTSGALALVLGCLAGLVLSLAWLNLAPGRAAQLHQVISPYVFFAVVAASLLAAIARRPATAGLTLALTGTGVGLAIILSLEDLSAGQDRRAWNAAHSEATKRFEGPVIFYGPPAAFAHAMVAPDRLLATPLRPGTSADSGLIEAACAAGYRVVLHPGLALAFERLADLTPAHPDVGGQDESHLLAVSCED